MTSLKLQTGLSHACANGFMPILELLMKLEDVDVNLPDNEGNTPLIYAAQAGHEEVVSYLLRYFPSLRVDEANVSGFTALMKAAIQGRTKTAKLLLFAGANPNRRDNGRRLCASEWARFCGRYSCADSIEKYIRSKKYFIAKTFFLSKDKWKSEPDLVVDTNKRNNKNRRGSNVVDAVAVSNACQNNSSGSTEGTHNKGRRDSFGWLHRHLSMKKKPPVKNQKRQSLSLYLELQIAAIAGSVPMLIRSSSSLNEECSSSKSFVGDECGDASVGGGYVGNGEDAIEKTMLKMSQDIYRVCCQLNSSSMNNNHPPSLNSTVPHQQKLQLAEKLVPTICITAGDLQQEPQTEYQQQHQQQQQQQQLQQPNEISLSTTEPKNINEETDQPYEQKSAEHDDQTTKKILCYKIK
ncbi:hypothetical protein HELRODRAFT_161480 [Helobdella robusta]|uniref:Uncharacterized protein n=1 Tax=Helobdella robusta TaxID=6412 RepID=T1ERI8_HELRO|nr:hypothetical protein HELRODRAFT_161480 [Helobdella robusta]ESO02236.1 hypothetical protein HELRODRAFT_161480 [Helobdella robusta]